MNRFERFDKQSLNPNSDLITAQRVRNSVFKKSCYERTSSVEELKKLTDLLEKNNIKYWIDYGTLLGAYRNKKVIPYDPDLDITVLLNETSKHLPELLCKNYYIMDFWEDRYICTYPKNNSKFTMAHIDIYFAYEDNLFIKSKIWDGIYIRSLFINRLQDIELNGFIFKAPYHLKDYLSIKYGDDFLIEKENFSPTENIILPNRFYTAYTYGVFDLFHIGHLNLFKNIKREFDKLIVGVHNDEQVITYKNKPIISYKDRLEIIKSCKYVDEVYENADLVVTDNLLNKINADYVIAGKENEEYINKYYKVNRDKLHLMERTKDISSTIIRNKFI